MSSPEIATGTEPADAPTLKVRVVRSIDEIAPDAWDACAGVSDPFVSHAFLRALEVSGSASRKTGWLPVHLVVEGPGNDLLAAAPLYLKSHSYGEYVFDWGWADAYERAGGRYYPKLQLSVPFTPVPGRRLLLRPGPLATAAVHALVRGLVATAHSFDVSSLHVTFCTDAEGEALEANGLLRREGVQYHWQNRGYGTFDDFLADLRSSKRKMVRKERAHVREAGVEIEVLHGDAVTPAALDAFYPYYLATVDKRWGGAYLTRAFFTEIAEAMADRIVLVLAHHEGRTVAAALNLRGADALYGRIWGCLEAFRFLHFEVCYYAAIEFALMHGIPRVEAGAQGQHKLQRGYAPVRTHSAHLIRDPGFRRAVARFLDQERDHMALEMRELAKLLPYRRDEAA